MEKEHLMRMKDLYGEDGEIILDQLEKREGGYFSDFQKLDTRDKQLRELIQIEELGEAAKSRQGDIQKLVRQINELAVIFKELSILVVEQGTVLDRIDYNVIEARNHVEKANKVLEKTVKAETSGRAKSAMVCLATSNLIMGFLLVLRFI